MRFFLLSLQSRQKDSPQKWQPSFDQFSLFCKQTQHIVWLVVSIIDFDDAFISVVFVFKGTLSIREKIGSLYISRANFYLVPVREKRTVSTFSFLR